MSQIFFLEDAHQRRVSVKAVFADDLKRVGKIVGGIGERLQEHPVTSIDQVCDACRGCADEISPGSVDQAALFDKPARV